ncbi:MAG TPA: PKD domain-containing protein [Thermoguttaceae bacterium]|nr:PKD domain-containing protein [Thermoguttaceae bacterium]
MTNNGTGGMNIRAEVLTNESVWDDTDIVHVLRGEITVDQHMTYSGLRLESAVDQSLVVKLAGANAGFTADGIPLDVDDRIGGTVQIIGQPGFPVVLTSLADDSIGASFDPDGYPHLDTNNNGPSTGSPGDWRSLLFDKYSNDRNVRVVLEPEPASNEGVDVNDTPFRATFLGEIAPNLKSGDENRVLGFEVHGYIRGDDPGDVDVYSFKARTGTEVWIDVDRTRGSLDTVVELVQANGTVLARSTVSDVFPGDGYDITGTASPAPLAKDAYNGGDYYTLNYHDAGFRVVLPGPAGQTGTYYVRVRSQSPDLSVLDGGLTSGEYQLQIRLQQRDEKPGSTVRFADIRYATTGIDVRGLPAHSPLLGESDETTASNNSPTGAQHFGNLLESDRNTISFSGALTATSDIDFYRFNADYARTQLGASIQAIGGVNDGGKTWATVFDLDYADGLTRGDTTMIVFDANGTPILIGRESNVIDDQPAAGQGNDLDDLTRGTVGKLDPFIGTVQLPIGIPGSVTDYYVAVSANGRLLTDLNQFYVAAATNTDIRLEPINSVDRIIEDHIGFQGYHSNGAQVDPTNTNGLFDISSTTSLNAHVRTFDLADVVLYVSGADQLTTVNPFFGQQITVVDTNLDETTNNVQGIEDIVFRSDGGLYAYRRLDSTQDSAGALVTVNSGTGALGSNSNDSIVGTRFEANSGGTGTTPDNTTVSSPGFLASDNVDALTFDRTAAAGAAPTYDIYYAVRANDRTSGNETTSVLYRARDGGSATESTTPRYGMMGNIQPSGVDFASATFTINAGGDTTSKTVQIVAKAPGAAGEGISVNVSKADAATQVIGVAGKQINLRLDTNPAATAQNFVDAINQDTNASRLVTARLMGSGNAGESTADVVAGVVMTTGSAGGTPLNGYVTGLAFSEFLGTNLYGVTSAGEFISINTGSGRATLIRDFSTSGISGFQGLALGPQNVQGGAYAGTLFAITGGGDLVAFNASGTLVPAFNGGVSVINTGVGSPTGLAFSPLDFNLWHPTTTRSADEGHGVNAPYDLSRTPSAEDRTHSDGNSTSTNSAYNQNEGQGGVSFYFGLENYVDNNNNPYLNYEASRTQLGVRNNDFQRDLTSGAIGTNYDLPGGAYGSLITDPFDLVSSTGTQTAKDRPTLYFNYFLQTEGQNTATANGAMRDSARAFISTDGGNTWNLLATNDTPKDADTELPTFLSHSRFADSADPRQRIQELYETSNWRQARVDLSDFVGRTGLVLRFDFSTAGTIVDADLSNNDPDLATPVDGYGSLNATNNNFLRGQNNAYEGFYLDDIIIGWSERGEMITAANAGATSYFAVPPDPDPEAPQLIEQGPYQVEIRRGFEHAANISTTDPEISVAITIDTNDRLIPTGLDSPPKTDNFESAPWPSFDPELGWVPMGLGSTSPWFVLPNILSGASNVARSAPFSYTGPGGPIDVPLGNNQNSTLQVTVATGSGNVTFDYKAVVGAGDAFQVFVDEIGENPAEFEHTNQSDTGWHGVSIPVTAGVHTFFFRYAKDGADPGGAPGNEGAMIDNVFFPGIGGMVVGDRNVERAQGAFIIEGNFVRDVAGVGIRIEAGAREQRTSEGGIEDASLSSNNPTPGSPINFDTQNIQRLAPGVVVRNNAVVRFGSTGIDFAGESNAAGGVPAAAVPFGKILNNTLYGGDTATGVGIRVADNSSPTLLNNILANTATGISIDGTSGSTVVGANFFKGNTSNGTVGSNAILVTDPAAPLFVDAAGGNFYLKHGEDLNGNGILDPGEDENGNGVLDKNGAIDSSLNSLADRPAIVAVTSPLGIPPAPILVPDRDLYDQLRVDDPSQDPPPGMGLNIFKDRGAIERADFVGPTARVSDPEDNGPLDFGPAENEVIVVDQNLTQFSIKLSDTGGIGIYDNSVVPEAVTVYRTTDMAAFGPDPATWPTPLTLGSDYLFNYDPINDVIRLVPGDGIWADDAIYTIILDNASDGGLDLVAIRDLAGNHLSGNRNTGPFAGMTVFTIQLTGLDYGDAPDPDYPSLLGGAELKDTVNGGARHLVDGRHYLGSGSHWETDARQNSTATGDTFDDGVTLESALVIGDHGDITVTASTAGFLNAWIDFNDDGVWDASEQIFTDEPLVAGANGLAVAMADLATVGLPDGEMETWRFARFRFSTEDGLGVTGYASDGEVEDYRLRLVRHPEDFGDAPADDGFGVEWYPTLVAQDGARHYLDPDGPRLGALADAELDGQPDATATGDDGDEDGIAFPVVFIAGQTMTIDVDMVGSPADGYLDAWIDFNQDGDWSDPDEKLVFVDNELIAGDVRTLQFDVPATVTSGPSFARFRVSRAGGLSFDGPAPDGEVEDYLVELGHLPVPIVGGGYVINEGEDLLLDGSGSSDPDGDDPLTFAWDLNDDGVFEIVAGTNPVVQVPWATLAALGLPTDGTPVPIALQVDDGVGGVDIDDTGTLTINNVDPTADADGPYTINEGNDLFLNGGGTDPGGDSLTYAWDLDNDGQFDDAIGEDPMVPWATLFSLGLASDGTPLTIAVQADDGEGGFGTAQSTLTINNLNPTGTDADGPYAITEGEDLSLSASSSDSGGDTLTYAWDLDNDGQFDDAVGMNPTVPWATLAGLGLASDGTTLPITVRVDDGDGGFQMAASTLTIDNLAPTADAGGPYVINEGNPLPLDGSGSSDPGDDSLTFAWDLDNDGLFDDATGMTPAVPWATLFGLGLPTDGTLLTITVQVDDGDGGVETAQSTLTINNVAPTADTGGPYIISEGEELLLNGSGSSDPGGDSLTYAWDLDGDGNFDDAVGENPTVSWATLFGLGLASDGTALPIALEVNDGEGGVHSAASTLRINNLTPTAVPDGPYGIDEGDDVLLDASGSSDPGGDSLTYAWDLDNDSQYDDAVGVTPTVTWATLFGLGLASDGTVLPIAVEVNDGQGGVHTAASTLTINNLTPTADPDGPYVMNEGDDVLLDASGSSDPGGDSLTYAWDLDDDGQFNDAVGVTPTVTWATLFGLGLASDGSALPIAVEVNDGQGGVHSAATTLTINNLTPTADPDGPYVIDEGDDVLLDGTGSTDPGGDSLIYRWDLDGDGNFDDAAGPTPTVPWATLFGLGLASDGTVLPIALQVDDGQGGVHTAASTLTINNLTPTANPDGPYVMNEGDDLPLNGSGSTDPGGDTLTYAWDLDNDGQFNDAVGAMPTVPWATLFGLGLASDGTVLPIALQVNDGQGGVHSAASTLTIHNVAPTAHAGGPYVINEGNNLPLNGSGSTDPGGDTLTYAWDLDNDGQFDDAVGVTPTVPWATLFGLGLASNGTSLPIALRVNDGQGGVHTAATTLTINNVDPTADPDGPYVIDEGENLPLDGSGSSDPGGDGLTYAWDLDNDGLFDDAVGMTPTVPWATLFGLGLASDGSALPIALEVNDGQGGVHTAATTLTIDNVIPGVTADDPSVTVTEGQTAANTGAFWDVGGDVVTVSASIGTVTQLGTQFGTWSWSFATTDGPEDGQTVTITATDSDGAPSTVTFALTVNNAAPQVAADSPLVTVNEGQLATNAGVFSDVGDDEVTITASNGTVTQDDVAGIWNWWFGTSDGPDENQIVTITATDSDGAWSTTAFTLIVHNVAPQVVPANPSVNVVEGQTATNAGVFWDDGVDFVFVSASIGTVSQVGEQNGTWSWWFDTTDGPTQSQTVTITATDSDRALSTTTFPLTVDNVAPTVNAGDDQSADEAATVGFSGSFTDPGSGDTHTITWNFGDGQGASGTLTPTHAYADDGVYTVTLTVEDDDGGEGADTMTVTVSNVAPGLTVQKPSVTVNEGQTATNTGTFSDVGDDDVTITVTPPIGTVTQVGTQFGTWSWSFHTIDGPDDSQIVTITADDGEGGVTTATFPLTVNNVAPTADAGGPYVVEEEGVITLDASASTDPGDDVLTYLWNLDGDTFFGETGPPATRGDEVGIHPTFSAAGLSGPSGVVVALRVRDELAAMTQDTATIWIAQTLGTVDFLEMNGLDPSAADLWYSLETFRQGFLTLEVLDPGATVTLYDESVNPLTAGAARIDYPSGAGQKYYFKLSGTASNVDLRIANLVSHVGTAVDVYGTDDPDDFEFVPTGSRTVTVNGVVYVFTDAESRSIAIHGGGADDTAELTGTSQKETAELWPDHGGLFGIGYHVTMDSVEMVTVHGGGGGDVAKLHDSDQPDAFEAWPNSATLSGPAFTHHVDDFKDVFAYADSGGVDTALLHDSPFSADTFIGLPNYGKLNDGATFWEYAVGFEQISATATAGLGYQDVAKLVDSSGDDVFEATPDEGKLKFNGSEDHFVQAAGFASLHGYANNGLDTAFLHDSPYSKDTFVGLPNYGKLYGPAFWTCANGFEQISATATAGMGYQDVAKLADSSGDDVFEATPDEGKLKFNGSEDHFVQAAGFASLYGYANNGLDRAFLQDSPAGKDTFVGLPDYAKLYDGSTYWRCAVDFEQVSATATAGTGFQDVAKLVDSPGADVFEATPDEGKMKFDGSENHFVQATGFRYLYGYATNIGLDTANLHDSPDSKDTFAVDANYGKLYGPDFWTCAKGFEQISATATAGAGFDDVARLTDSSGNDVFEATPDEGKMKFNGSENHFAQATGFRYLYGYATNIGLDTANLHDSPNSKDTFIANPDYGKLFGPDFWMYAAGFERLSATATAGVGFDDVARLTDSSGADVFEATPQEGKLKFNGSEDDFIRAAGFRYLYGYATSDGIDTANLHDSPNSKDTFIANPDYGKLFGPDFWMYAAGFGHVSATATAGVGFDDRAALQDSYGADAFEAGPTSAQLTFEAGGTLQANNFRFVEAVSWEGDGANDTVRLRGRPGSKDTFTGTPDYAKLEGIGFSNRATQFDTVTAIGTARDGDVANLVGSPDGFDIFEGNAAHWLSQPYAKMYGLGYSHELLYFDKVLADAGAGTYDQAYLWDSKFDDLLEVVGDSATLSGTDIPFLFGVTSFDYVKAESTTQGDGDAVNAATGYLFDLDLEGWWENL